MVSTTDKSPGTTIHPVDGLELALLAAQAAIELDSLLLGTRIPLTAVTRLAETLQTSIDDSNNEGGAVHPSTAAVVRHALDHAQATPSVATIEQLMLEAWKIVDGVKDPDSTGDKQRLERSRSFCAALSLCATSQLHAIAELEPRHPSRI